MFLNHSKQNMNVYKDVQGIRTWIQYMKKSKQTADSVIWIHLRQCGKKSAESCCDQFHSQELISFQWKTTGLSFVGFKTFRSSGFTQCGRSSSIAFIFFSSPVASYQRSEHMYAHTVTDCKIQCFANDGAKKKITACVGCHPLPALG